MRSGFISNKIIYGITGKKGGSFLYLIALMLFFWAIYNGIFSYVTPILISSAGYSDSELGIIYATSSIAGAISDFFINKYLTKSHYLRLYFYMFFLSLIGLLVLYHASTFLIFVMAMIIWGIFYDLMSIASFDFVGNYTKKKDNAYSYGIIELAGDLGGLIAPLIAGYVIVKEVNGKAFSTALLFLSFSFLVFAFILILHKHRKRKAKNPLHEAMHCKKPSLSNLQIWRKVGKILFPVLIITAFLNVIDAFFWTLGPLYSLKFPEYSDFGGLLLTAYMLPSILADFLVNKFTKKFGKKRTAFISILTGSLVLIPLIFFSPPMLILGITLISSTLNSIAWPAIKSAFADYINESKTLDREIESLADFFNNIGYVIGPVLAGIFAGLFGLSPSFGILGIIGIVLTIILMRITPKHIRITFGI